jgi:Ala-tRNA(Pro) deacylase
MAKLGDVIEYLKRNGVPYEVIEHVPAFSAHEVAVVSHVQDKDLAKTLIVHTDNSFCMVVLPADHRLDDHLLHQVVKAKHLHLAHEDDLRPLFPDCELGAMPPFGNLYALPVYMDQALTEDSEIVFNACSHTKSLRMKMNDYLHLVKPIVGPLSVPRFEVEER